MTNYESTSYFVEDKAGESVAFTVLPPSEGQATAGTGEHDPVLKLWSTQVMPDNRVINVEVGFSRDDVGGLQSYLNDQFGRGKATVGSPTPQTQRDNDNAEYFKSGWMSALREVLMVAEVQGQGEALLWARNQEPGAGEDVLPAPESVRPRTPYDPAATARQCPVIYSGIQCSNTEGQCFQLGHTFLGANAEQVASLLAPMTGDGAATPPATAPTSTPVAPGGEQADVSATGVGSTEAAPSSAPAEKKRTRRTKLEMAYDRALEAHKSAPSEQTWADLVDAQGALQAKDPGNERLSQTVGVLQNTQAEPTASEAAQMSQPAQPTVQFAGEPVNPFTQPAPVQPQYAAFAGQPVGQVPQGQEYQPLVSSEESQAAAAFPCPAVHSDGMRRCVRPYGHELQTANNPEPKPHAFATDPASLGGMIQPVQQAPQADPVEAFIPMPAQPQQPAFSVTTPALTGMTNGGAQILSFQTPPTPADPTAFQVQGANLQPPAPAAPFLQPTPNGGQ